MATAAIKFNGTLGSVSNLTIGQTVNLSNNDNTGATAWQWSFIDIPENSTATLSTPTTNASSFVADIEGTYLVELIVNPGGSQVTDTEYGAILTLELGLRIPAAGEMLQESSSRGWAQSVNRLISQLERDQRAGTIHGGISSGAIAAGVPGRQTGLGTLANGESLPTIGAASASTAAQAQNIVWVLNSASGANQHLNTLVDGLVLTVLDFTAANLGDPVYLTNAGGISLSPGTVPTTVGSVVTQSNPGVMNVAPGGTGTVGTNQILDHAVTQVKLALTLPVSTVYAGVNPNAGGDAVAGGVGDLLINTSPCGFVGWYAQTVGAPAVWSPFGRTGSVRSVAASATATNKDRKMRVTSTAAQRTVTLPDVTTIADEFDLPVMDASFASNPSNPTLVVGFAGEAIGQSGVFTYTPPNAAPPGIPADGTGIEITFTWNKAAAIWEIS